MGDIRKKRRQVIAGLGMAMAGGCVSQGALQSREADTQSETAGPDMETPVATVTETPELPVEVLEVGCVRSPGDNLEIHGRLRNTADTTLAVQVRFLLYRQGEQVAWSYDNVRELSASGEWEFVIPPRSEAWSEYDVIVEWMRPGDEELASRVWKEGIECNT